MSRLIPVFVLLALCGVAQAQRRPTSRATVISKYVKSTPAQDAAEIAEARNLASDVQTTLKLNFKELQTAHFLIFTDWPRAEHDFLRTNLEAAYNVVSREFDIPTSENIFIGKLPVFMFNQVADFKKFSNQYDEINVPDATQGYFAGREDGVGHLVMWKPDETNAPDKRQILIQWAYTLTHEFTHAFVARYRSNRDMPTWLNEGIAEVIASRQFPRPQAIVEAKNAAAGDRDISEVFTEDGFKGPAEYPIMRTLVETLLRRDRAAFLKYFNAIKDGSKPVNALKKYYGWDYTTLTQAWQRDMQTR